MPLTLQKSPDEVSPELVLVDPELARQARPVALTGAWTVAVRAAAIRARSTATPASATTSPTRWDAPPKKSSLHRLSIAATAAAGGFLVVTTLAGTSDYRSIEPQHQAPTKRVVTEGLAPNPATKPTVQRLSSARRTQPVEWQRARFATFYQVVFVRQGARRLQIYTRRTALSVRSLRSGQGLRIGRYRWFVRPGYGNPRLRNVPGRAFYGPVTSRGVVLVRGPD